MTMRARSLLTSGTPATTRRRLSAVVAQELHQHHQNMITPMNRNEHEIL
jgi:hypothetical protein